MKPAHVFTSLLLALAALGQAAAFQNGSFELGTNIPTYSTPNGARRLTDGNGDIVGWTVGGEAAWFCTPTWLGTEGIRFVSLAYYQAGSISQTFDTTVGQTYTVDFDMCAEGADETIKTMDVSAATETATYTYDSAGWNASLPNARWDAHQFVFIATGSSTTLTFADPTPGYYGPAVDNVRIEAVPEPTSMLALVLGASSLLRRRKKA